MVSQYFFGGTIRAKASLVLGRSVRSATASRRRERTANVRPLLEFASIRTDAIDAVSFLNRDHIILVTINQGEIVVTTTAGTKITFPASAATLDKFVDDLANQVDSNFVAVAVERCRFRRSYTQ